MRRIIYNYEITFENGKIRKMNCSSLLEAFSDSILYAMVNAWQPTITQILNIETGEVFKPCVNFNKQ